MGATATSTNPADFANRIQTYFNPKLLKALDFNLLLAGYGLKDDYPAIGTTIRFFRPRAANKSYVGAIAEGTTTTNKTEVAVGYVDVALSQRGALSEITDVVQAIDLLKTVNTYVTTMGGDAALDFDSVIRDSLIAGLLNSNGTYKTGPTATKQAYFERFAGVTNTGTSSDDFATLLAEQAANSKMTRSRHLVMVTQMKDGRVPKIGGKFVAAVSPVVMKDVREDTDWIAAATRMADGSVFKGADIALDGCAFVEQDNAFIEDQTYGTYDDVDDNGNGLIYTTLYLGADAFCIPTLTNKRAGGSGMGPRMTVLAGPDKSDPQNLKTTIAWKAFYGAKPFLTNVAGEVPRFGLLRTKVTMV